MVILMYVDHMIYRFQIYVSFVPRVTKITYVNSAIATDRLVGSTLVTRNVWALRLLAR